MTHDPSTIANTICQRRGGRHELDYRDGSVELASDSGEPRRLPLINISMEGLAFELDPDSASLTIGSAFPVTVRVGDHSIRGTFTVRHCDPSFSRGLVCGGEFAAETPFDRRRMEGMLHAVAEELQLLRARHAGFTRTA